jgi:DNA-binding beta-propeller fold protein YncE
MHIKSHFALISLIAIIFFCLSCSPRVYNTVPKTIYPTPPDTARIQYLTSISNSLDIQKKQSGFSKMVVGEKKQKSIHKPYGVFIRKGKIYVCDVALNGGMEIIDLENRTFEYFIPEGTNKLKLSLNSYIDSNETRFIADIESHRIVVFDKNGDYITAFGTKENIKPSDIFIHGKKIYVVDSGNNRVNVYDRDSYKLKGYFPKTSVGEPDYIYKPTNIYVTDKKIYVSDMGDGNVKIYNHKWEYLNTVGKYGKNIGEFVRPKGIAVDRESNLYVVDASIENVQIFNDKGELLMFFGGPYEKPGDMWLPTKVIIDYDNLKYFEKYVSPEYDLKYLIIVANQFGPDMLNVYGRIVPAANEPDLKKQKKDK